MKAPSFMPFTVLNRKMRRFNHPLYLLLQSNFISAHEMFQDYKIWLEIGELLRKNSRSTHGR